MIHHVGEDLTGLVDNACLLSEEIKNLKDIRSVRDTLRLKELEEALSQRSHNG